MTYYCVVPIVLQIPWISYNILQEYEIIFSTLLCMICWLARYQSRGIHLTEGDVCGIGEFGGPLYLTCGTSYLISFELSSICCDRIVFS